MKLGKILLLTFYLLGLGFLVVPQKTFAEDAGKCCICHTYNITNTEPVTCEGNIDRVACIDQSFITPGGNALSPLKTCTFEPCSVSPLCPKSQSQAPLPALIFKPNVPIPGFPAEIKVDNALLANYIKTLYKFFVGIAGILAVIMIAFGGLQWLFSGGSSEKISKAKETIIGAVMGLILALGSYLILNTINPALVSFKSFDIKTLEKAQLSKLSGCCFMTDQQSTLGVSDWTAMDYYVAERVYGELDCKNKFKTTFNAHTYWSIRPGVLLGMTVPLPLYSGTYPFYVSSVQYFADDPNGLYTYEVKPKDTHGTQCSLLATDSSWNSISSQPSVGLRVRGWTFNDGIEEQLSDASPDLLQLLDCLRGVFNDIEKISGKLEIGRISSISDSNYTRSSDAGRARGGPAACDPRNGTCPTNPECIHACNSCHYGNGTGDGKSYAVDIGDIEENKADIETAITYCSENGLVGFHLPESDHYHISTTACRKN